MLYEDNKTVGTLWLVTVKAQRQEESLGLVWKQNKHTHTHTQTCTQGNKEQITPTSNHKHSDSQRELVKFIKPSKNTWALGPHTQAYDNLTKIQTLKIKFKQNVNKFKQNSNSDIFNI